jgi:hypothetical protein
MMDRRPSRWFGDEAPADHTLTAHPTIAPYAMCETIVTRKVLRP